MRRGPVLFVAGLVVVLGVAVVVSQLASGDPDGLEYVAEQEGFADRAEDHPLDDHAFADYGGEDRRNLAVAGLVGVVATLAIGYGVFWLARSREREPVGRE